MRPEELAIPTRLHPLKPSQAARGQRTPGASPAQKESPFSKVLASELASRSEGVGAAKRPPGVTFSAHAQARLNERNISLSQLHQQRLENGVQLAARKGSKNTLVLMDDTAFIVSVKNKKVITAITRDAAVENVFTQIDSATIV